MPPPGGPPRVSPPAPPLPSLASLPILLPTFWAPSLSKHRHTMPPGVEAAMSQYADPHFADEEIVIKKLSVGPHDNNVYVIVDPTTDESVLVDAADEAERILAALAGTNVRAIWNTH